MIEYQDSGVEWIGQIPSHWEVKRLKDLTILGSGTTPKSSKEQYYTNGIYPWLNTGDVQNCEIINNENYITDEAIKDYPILKQYPSQTIILAMYGGGTIGNVGIMSYPAYVNQACCTMICNKNLYYKYLFYYLLVMQNNIISTGVGGTQINLNQNKISTYLISLPPLSEQQAIADYLDEKTSEIDSQVSLIKEKVAALQKLKQSLINKVVTKGLNPNAELKDSGEDWLGQIPAHWEVKRLKSFARTIKGKAANYQDSPSNGAYKVLSVECLRQENANFYDYAFTDDAEQICTSEDFVVIWDGAGVGEFLKAKDGVLSSTIAKFKFTSKDILPSYFWHWRYKIEMIIKSIPTGMGIPHLNPVLLNNLKFAIPPLSEQQAIADYLDEKTSEIDEQISLLNQKAEAYNKLKQSLIDEVVTGKRRI